MDVNPVEIIAVILNLAYVILLIRQNIWCWPFGILASALSIYLFIDTKLYSEAILYLFYVIIGIYGWVHWHTKDHSQIPIIKWNIPKHFLAIVMGFLTATGLGYLSNTYTDAERSYIDSTTTIFSFFASFLEAQKVLSSWIYWIILNGISIWLYADRGLLYYGGLSVLLTLLSVKGFLDWRTAFQKQ